MAMVYYCVFTYASNKNYGVSPLAVSLLIKSEHQGTIMYVPPPPL